MVELRTRRVVTARAVRGTDFEEDAKEWAGTTPEQRMEAVWDLTRLCLLWNSREQDAPRLQRSIIRAQRKSR